MKPFVGFRQHSVPAFVLYLDGAGDVQRMHEVQSGIWVSHDEALVARICSGCCDCLGRGVRTVTVERRAELGSDLRFALRVDLPEYDDGTTDDAIEFARRVRWALETGRPLREGESPAIAVLGDDLREKLGEQAIPDGWP